MTGLAAAPSPLSGAAELRPLRLGSITVWPPVVLAPMAGVTNAPFRRLCRAFGAAGLAAATAGASPHGPGPGGAAATDAPGGLFVTEMITARGLVERNDKTLRMARFAPDEPVRSIQLYGSEPATVGEAVRFLTGEHRADHIDLNFGCPVAKVTRKGGGAALPVRRGLLRAIVRAAVAAAGPVPVTVKLRVGVDDRLRTFLDAGRIAEGEGAAAVTLHGRTAEQHYSGRADWGAIAALVEAVHIPVLGNGDIWEAADARRMMDETGCSGVVVGRGCLGRPWLFRDLALALAGAPVPPAPPLGKVAEVLRRHARLLAAWLTEPVAVRDIRKHVGWYLHGYPVGGEIRRRLATTGSLAALEADLDRLPPDLVPVPGAAAGPRGKVSGPIRVVLPDGWTDDVDDPAPLVTDDLHAVSGG